MLDAVAILGQWVFNQFADSLKPALPNNAKVLAGIPRPERVDGRLGELSRTRCLCLLNQLRPYQFRLHVGIKNRCDGYSG